ncbi:MAG: gamma-glutamyl-gamma-aminobutyrate hydrolase family protein [Candidatus Eremiobacteraeota bacterium]|nr:gamma-glutamyl-gamma-aminobutyrate hydrolase family protein [Candidatus Eremiobacteraeota bacterium]
MGPLRFHRKILPALLFFAVLAGALSFRAGAESPGDPAVMLLYTPSQYKKLKAGDDPLKNYSRALTNASLRPLAASPESPVSPDEVQGLLIPGGGDVDPSFYHEPSSGRHTEADLDFDRYELQVLGEAWKRDMPVLAICRGEQLLNVYCRGTLVQDLPRERGVIGGVDHRDPRTKWEKHHTVAIKEGTLLRQILGSSVKIVNTAHHQAVKSLGEGLKVNAEAQDGVIEGIECPGRTFVLGVQFHPERLVDVDRLFRRIFERFHDEAQKYGEIRARGHRQ